MKNKYPFLASWKAQGLGEFPKIPEEFFQDGAIEAAKKALVEWLEQLDEAELLRILTKKNLTIEESKITWPLAEKMGLPRFA